MSILASFLEFHTPPTEFLESIQDLLATIKSIFWYKLISKIQACYNLAIISYILICATYICKAWSVSESILIEKVTGRDFEFICLKQGQIKSKTVETYLLILKSYYVDCNFFTYTFLSSYIDYILSDVWYFFPYIKKDYLLIIKKFFENITLVIPILIEDYNIKTTCKVA